MSTEWATKYLNSDCNQESEWLLSGLATLRPWQIGHFQEVAELVPIDIRNKIWSDFDGIESVTKYMHDILRVQSYLLKTFHPPSEYLNSLLLLYASFTTPGHRVGMEELLISTKHLHSLAKILRNIPMEKQLIVLDVAGNSPSSFDRFLFWFEDSKSQFDSLYMFVRDVNSHSNLFMWLQVIIQTSEEIRTQFIQLLGSFHSEGRLKQLECVFAEEKNHQKIIMSLLGLSASGELPVLNSLLPQLSPGVNSTLITTMQPYLASLKSLATRQQNPLLERTIQHIGQSDAKPGSISLLLQFTASLSDPWPFLEYFLSIATQSPYEKLFLQVFVELDSNEQTCLALWGYGDEDLSLTSALIQYPLDPLRRLLQISNGFGKDDHSILTPHLKIATKEYLNQLISLLESPPPTRLLLCSVLEDIDDPSQLIQTLDGLRLLDGQVFEITLKHLTSYSREHKRDIAAKILQPDFALNQQILQFLIYPPTDMETLGCLRLLLHVPTTSYHAILQIMQSPARSPLELLVLTDVILAVYNSDTIERVAKSALSWSEDHLRAFFGYIEHVSTEDSHVLLDVIATFPNEEVILLLELSVGLSQSILRELNLFISRLNSHGRLALLKLIVDPRRNVISRLIMSIHTLDTDTIVNILEALLPHAWEFRSLLVEQFRLIDDAVALGQLVTLHRSLATQPHHTRDGLETYAMLASICSKSTQLQLIAVLYRMDISDQMRFLLYLKGDASWQPTETIMSSYWMEENISRLCSLLLQHNANEAIHLVQVLYKLENAYRDPFIQTCRAFTPDLAYFIHVLSIASQSNVHDLSPAIFGGTLSAIDHSRLATCLHKMQQCYSLDLAVHLLLGVGNLPRFLFYFHKVPAQMLLVQALAEFKDTVAALVHFFQAIDMDDAIYIMSRMSSLDPTRKKRVAAMLEQHLMSPLSGRNIATIFNLFDGCQVKDSRYPALKSPATPLTPPSGIGVTLTQPLDPVWSWTEIEARTISRKTKRVGQFPITPERSQRQVTSSIEKEFYRLTLAPNDEFSLELSTPLREDIQSPPPKIEFLIDNQADCGLQLPPPSVFAPPSTPQILAPDLDDSIEDPPSPPFRPTNRYDHVMKDSYRNLKKPLHTLLEEDHHDTVGLPPLRKPSSMKSLRGLMPALQKVDICTEKHKTHQVPASSYAAISSNTRLMHWPPTRIRVAKTPEAKQKIFDARIRKSMGTTMPLIQKPLQHSHSSPNM